MRLDYPKISIITVVYNGARTIEETVQSVLSQDYPNVEYIIIDGASKDDTMMIVNKYRSKLSLVVSEPDKGIYDAMNKGIARATGEIIGILNADDVYARKDILTTVVRTLNQSPDAGVAYGNLYIFDENLKKVFRKWVSRPYYSRFFENGEMPPHPTLFVRREIYEKYGKFRLNFKVGADYEFMLRILRKNNVSSVWINEFLVFMRKGGESTGSLKNIIRQNREAVSAWKMNDLKLPLTYYPFKFVHRIRQFF